MTSPWNPIEDPVEGFLRDVQENGLENSLARRYYSKYEGVVISNADPQQQGRVRVRVYALKRRDPLDLWAYPSAPYAGQDYGIYFPPEIGDSVWVWFDHGNAAVPGISGGWWLAPKKVAENSQVPSEFKGAASSSPTRRGIKTKGGHAILFEDDPSNSQVKVWSGVQSGQGVDAVQHHSLTLSDVPAQERAVLTTNNGHTLSLIDNPSVESGVRIETVSGHLMYFDETNQLIRVQTPQGRMVTISDVDQSIRMVTPTGSVSLSDTVLTETVPAKVTTVAGTFQETITGASTLTFLGGLTLSITGLALIGGLTATAFSMLVGAAVPASVTLGALTSGFFRLVTEAFLVHYNANVAIHNANVAVFNTHVHPFIGNLGVPSVTTPTVTPQLPVAPADVNTMATSTVVAN